MMRATFAFFLVLTIASLQKVVLAVDEFVPVSGQEYYIKSNHNFILNGKGNWADGEAEVWSSWGPIEAESTMRWLIEPHPTKPQYYQIKLAAGGTQSMLYIKNRNGKGSLELTRDRFVGSSTYWQIKPQDAYPSGSFRDGYFVTAVDYKDQNYSKLSVESNHGNDAHVTSSTSTTRSAIIIFEKV